MTKRKLRPARTSLSWRSITRVLGYARIFNSFLAFRGFTLIRPVSLEDPLPMLSTTSPPVRKFSFHPAWERTPATLMGPVSAPNGPPLFFANSDGLMPARLATVASTSIVFSSPFTSMNWRPPTVTVALPAETSARKSNNDERLSCRFFFDGFGPFTSARLQGLLLCS